MRQSETFKYNGINQGKEWTGPQGGENILQTKISGDRMNMRVKWKWRKAVVILISGLKTYRHWPVKDRRLNSRWDSRFFIQSRMNLMGTEQFWRNHTVETFAEKQINCGMQFCVQNSLEQMCEVVSGCYTV